MASKRFSYSAALVLFFFAALSALSQTLPDAPSSHDPGAGPSPAHAAEPHSFAPSGWYGVVDPGEKVSPLYARDKMMFWLHEEITPIGWVPVFFSSGWEQLINGDPKYGSDSAAFGERLGASALRVTSYRFFSDSLLPTLTHEDPRYFRKAYGSPRSRSAYAAKRVLVARRDNNSEGFNYSDFFGHLAGAALTAAYYPGPSANARVVMTSWGISLAGDAGGKLFLEFWPDIRDGIFHRHKDRP